MNKIKLVILVACFSIVAGAIGGLLFQLFVFPNILQNSYFAQFQFIKNFKEGKIVINTREQIFVQENAALQGSIEAVEKSIVGIQTSAEAISGSGLIITSDGLIIALAEVVPAGGSYSVMLDGTKFKAQILKRDLKNNLALLKIDGSNLKTCKFSDPSQIKLGERVFLLGVLPSDLSFATNEGIVRSILESSIKTNISESSSLRSSPLFDIYGSLVGLTTMDSAGRVSAVPIQKIKEFSGL